MTRRVLFAAAAACACLLAAPAVAGTLDSYPIVTPGASDKLCGYANASGHATQCATAQAVASLAPATPPGGSTGQIQFNNASVFAGVNTMTYCPTCNGGGPLLALTTPVSITNQTFTFNNGSINWMSAIPSGGGGTLVLTTGSNIQWANQVGFSYASAGVLDLGNGGVGDTTGELNAAVLYANTEFLLPPATPCDGTITTTLDSHCVPLLLKGPVAEGLLTTGQGKIFVDSTSRFIIAAHTMNATAGLAIQGSVAATCTNTSGMGECYQSDVTLNTATGVPVASVEDQGNWFGIGVQRALPCPIQADQGCATQGSDYVSQLIFMDAIAGGTLSEPIEIYQSGNLGNGLTGWGHTTPATIGSSPNYQQNIIRLGAVQDFNTPWDDIAGDQPDIGTNGCLSLGHANGSATVNSGGLGVTWDERLCSNGVIAEFYNTAKSAAAPVEVSFVRTVPVTVAGLATADASPADGDSAYVTDSTSGSCVLNTVIVGGSSVHCRVHYDSSSSSWKAG